MKRASSIIAPACVLALALAAAAQTRPASHAPASRADDAAGDAALRARIHAFLDRTIGWQQLDQMEIESISKPDASGLRTVKVLLAKGTQHQEGTYYITADGREIIEGEASRLSADPWSGVRSKIETRGAPAVGPADAPVTIVEYSDLECPFCKQESGVLDQLMQQDPGKVRLVFKFWPMTKIHPWSMQAALAAECVVRDAAKPSDFWDFERAVFAAQDNITPADAASRLRDLALESAVTGPAYDACINSPATHSAVAASIANGDALGVNATPTLFINGRVIPGALQLEQLRLLVDHEAQIVTSEGASASRGAGLQTGALNGKQCGECKPLPPIKHR